MFKGATDRKIRGVFMNHSKQLFILVFVLVCKIFSAQDTQFVPIQFTGNGNIQTQLPAGGASMPEGYSTLGGIPFQLQPIGNNYWCAALENGSNPIVLSIPVDIENVQYVHTLINCYWGKPYDTGMAAIEFFGTNGAYYKTTLVANVNIRDFDYTPPMYADSIDTLLAREIFTNKNGQHLDRQTFALPESFTGQRLTKIQLTDNGSSNVQRIFLYGCTVQKTVFESNEKFASLPFSYNGRLQTALAGGSSYPDGAIMLKGIPFQIPSTGENWWHASTASGANPKILDVDVNLYGVSEIYTLINLYWGVHGDSTKAMVQCIGTTDSFTIALYTGRHLRDFDYLGAVYENDIDSGITTEVYNNGSGQRLDRQQLILPSHFLNDTLKTIRIIDNGAEQVQRMFLYGLTVKYANQIQSGTHRCIAAKGIHESHSFKSVYLLNGQLMPTRKINPSERSFQGYLQENLFKINAKK
jgi:hypothetical protein